MMFFGPVYMILTLAALVAALVIAVRWLAPSNSGGPMAPAGRTPLEVLKDRFARGEIDKNEYEERRRILAD